MGDNRDARTLRVSALSPLISSRIGHPDAFAHDVQEWADDHGLRGVEIEMMYEDDGVTIRAYRNLVFETFDDAILFKMMWL